MDKKHYELILFDLDGTLLDTSAGIFGSVRYAEQAMGFTPVAQEQLRLFVGPPPMQMYQQIYGADAETAAKATAYHRQYSREKAIYEATVYPGMIETLTALQQQGYKLGVATLKGQKIAEKVLKVHGLSGFFQVIVGMDEGESFTKCKTIQVAMAQTNTTGKALMVGDSEYDYVGACEASVDFLGVTYGFGIEENESRFPCIAQPQQLRPWLQQKERQEIV